MKDLMEDHAGNLTSGYSNTYQNYKNTGSYESESDKRHRKFRPGPVPEPDLDEEHSEIYRELTLFPQSAEDIDKKLRKKKICSPGETGICLILMELCLSDNAIQVSPGQFIRNYAHTL